MKFIFLAFALTLQISISIAQTTNNIYGLIREKASGEPIPNAVVMIKDTHSGCVSNSYGFYSLPLPNKTCIIVCSYLGFKPFIKEIDGSKENNFDIELEFNNAEISEVVVVAKNQENNILTTIPGKQNLKISQVKSMPGLGGEADVLKSLQFLPGVQSANEGSTNLHVRGGNYDQNLFLLDEAPVYNPSHALGFFSVFNADAINSVDFYKSIYPSKYGGRLSSVVDIKMKEGNNKAFEGTSGIGIMAAKICLEGPIIKDKASFLFSGRYSYLGALLNGFSFATESNNLDSHNKIDFYDYNLKFNYIINPKNRLYLSVYSGDDKFSSATIDTDNEMNWGNLTSTLRWNHIYNPKLFSNTSLIYSKYHYQYVLLESSLNFDWTSSINQVSLKSDYDYVFNTFNRINFGVDISYHNYEPGKIEPKNDFSNSKTIKLDTKHTGDYSLYLEDMIKLSDKFILNTGVRFTLFTNIGAGKKDNYSPETNEILSVENYGRGEIYNTYNGLEPRLALEYLLNASTTIKTSYNQTKQYAHLISNSSAGLPTDVWLPSSKNIKPQSSDQFSMGVYKQLFKNRYEFSAEIYYKNISDVVDYIDNAELFINENIETQLLRGDAVAKGLEVFFKKKTGKFQGWLSYTWADVQQKVPGVNQDKWYNTKYNVKHNLGLVAFYKFNDRYTLSTSFKYKSGGYVTIPQGYYVYQGIPFPYYSERNGYQLEDFHQLDFSLTYNSKRNKTRKHAKEWVFSVFNVYNRANIFSFYAKYAGSKVKAYKMYLYGIVPSVTYNIKF